MTESLDEVVREAAGRVLAVLIRDFGDFDLAEEALQDALVTAVERWSGDGTPEAPAAWLLTVARRKAIDRLRRDAARAARHRAAAGLLTEPDLDEVPDAPDVPDERLRLVFTCCHPALPPDARVALTLRALGGLSTAEIARAFLVSESTMSQRLVRAKAKIRTAGIPYRVPRAEEVPHRWPSVLAVLYCIFTEGYSATVGPELVRRELCDEAIRLARITAALLPDEPEVLGVLALMLLHDARRGARTDDDGNLVLLHEQDRSRWDAEQIAVGVALLDRALHFRAPGRYQIEAAIAALHARSPHPDATDWPQIATLYVLLEHIAPSPVVALNRAAAVSMADGPAVALPMLDRLTPTLGNWYLFHATRADVLRRLGRERDALAAYQDALRLVSTDAERRFLERRTLELCSHGT